MHAFVAGATGFTGREVVRLLRDRGVETVAHVRPDSSRREEWATRFEALGAEVDHTAWEEPAMRARLRELRPGVVFALLGTTKKRGRAAATKGREETYETVDYGLSALLLRAARDSGADPRFVYLSSMGVGPSARGAYLKVRHRLETELRESGLPWVIARPSFIVGERDEERLGERLGAGALDAAFDVAARLGVTRLRDRFGSQSNTDLAAALVHLALAPDGADRIVESDGLKALAAR